MENYENQQSFADYTVVGSEKNTGAVSKKFIANVFGWMFAGLALSAFFAFLFATTPSLMQLLINTTDRGASMSGLGWLVFLSPIGFVMLMSFGFNKLSASALVLLFLVYSSITGISLSFILLVYTSSSVMGCFATASVMFGVMAVMGYTTDKDLTSFGNMLFMGLIGIIVAGFINFFLNSSALGYLISIIGVMIFTGLTAYDTQVLKRIGAGLEYEGTSAADTKKLAIMGALRLYLDFINLFLMLLRLFGRRK